MQQEYSTAPKIVMIGGGTGSFTLLSSLKHYVKDITALVNMVDSGGSTGVLRDELGALPPGDVRQCLVALSQSSDTMRELFNYRFPEGTFGGHSFGNLFLSSLEKITDSFGEAVEVAGEVLNIQGRVLPITLDDISLVYESDNGEKVIGEHKVGNEVFAGSASPKLSLEPAAQINLEADTAIRQADMVVIAPGNLYLSIIPALMVEGVREALTETDAKLIYVANLVNDRQTQGLTVDGLVKELERYVGDEAIDYVLYNTAQPSQEQIDLYAKKDLIPVTYDQVESDAYRYTAIGKELLSKFIQQQDENDQMIERNLIRHDGDIVARELMRIFYS